MSRFSQRTSKKYMYPVALPEGAGAVRTKFQAQGVQKLYK